MTKISSPNFDTRDPSVGIKYILLHYTGMPDFKSAIDRMADPSTKVSAHYLIDEDGGLYRLVDETKRAWHAGQSFWRGIHDINSASVGIELVNPGHEFGYRNFTPPQINTLKTLMRNIAERHGLPLSTSLLAHSDVAPSRKQDPGEFFPWQSLAAEGFGIWPDLWIDDFSPASPQLVAELLGHIGYDVHDTGCAITAFQRRFFPENITGVADENTVARIRSIKRLMAV